MRYRRSGTDKNHSSVRRFKDLAGDTAVDPSTDPGATMAAHDDAVDVMLLSKVEDDACRVTHLHRYFAIHLPPLWALADAFEVITRTPCSDLPLLIDGDSLGARNHVFDRRNDPK